MGIQQHLVVDPELGEQLAYAASDAAEMLGVTAKTIISRAQSSGDVRAELRGWPPRTQENPNRSWMVDAHQIDRLSGSDVPELRAELERLRFALDTERADRSDEAEVLEAERSAVADERAVLGMERTSYQQAEMDLLRSRNVELEFEVRRLRASLASVGSTVSTLTAQLARTEN